MIVPHIALLGRRRKPEPVVAPWHFPLRVGQQVISSGSFFFSSIFLQDLLPLCMCVQVLPFHWCRRFSTVLPLPPHDGSKIFSFFFPLMIIWSTWIDWRLRHVHIIHSSLHFTWVGMGGTRNSPLL